jgi:deazaflavin-dependent oxidoreductase (nitroreductase family)
MTPVIVIALLMVGAHVAVTNHQQRHGATLHATANTMMVINMGITALLRLGVPLTILGPMMLLTVRGRRSGRPRTTPVDVHEYRGQRYLIATHGEGQWVQNLRVAVDGTLSLGWRHQTFSSVELPPEAGGPIIRDVLAPLLAAPGIRGTMLRQQLGLRADSALQDYVVAARSHPVFALEPGLSHSHQATSASARV